MQHFSFMGIVSKMAKSNWGREFSSDDAAEAALANDPARLAAYALLEMLNRFNKFAKVMSESQSCDSCLKPEKPGNAKPFPSAKVGDFLYSGSIYEGISRSVVVGIDAEGFAVVAGEWTEGGSVCHPYFACNWHYSSIAEALAADAESDIEYHGKRFQIAKECQEAIASGADLSRFENGMDDE